MDDKPKRGKSPFDRKDPHPENAVVPDPEQEGMEEDLETGLEDTFPASDPPAVSQPSKPGRRGPRGKGTT